MKKLSMAWMLVAVAGAGCGSGAAPGETESAAGTGGGDAASGGTGGTTGEGFTVDAEGASFTTEDGFTIEIPAGAVRESTVITVERTEELREDAIGTVYRLGPDGQQFDEPVRIELPIAVELEAPLAEDAFFDASVFTAPGGTEDYERLEKAEVGATHVVSETTHFSNFYVGLTTPTVMTKDHFYPTAIASDNVHVFFTSGGTQANAPADSNDGFVYKVKIGEKTATTMGGKVADPRALWVDGTHVYFASGGDKDPVIKSSIRRIHKTTGQAQTLYEGGYLVGLIGDATHVYFGDAEGQKILKLPLAGGTATVLATAAGTPEYLALDAGNVYWTGGKATNKVYKVAKAGGTVKVLAATESEPTGIAVNAAHVYWASTGDGGLYRVPLAGGAKTKVFQGGSLAGLALRGNILFSTDTGHNRCVNAHNLSTGRTTVLALNQRFAMGVAAPSPGKDVFWVNGGDYDFEGSIVAYAGAGTF